MGSPLCHFEFMSNDPERCKQFYGGVLGWEFDDASMPGYTLIKTGGDPGGGLMKCPDDGPGPGMHVYYLVDDVAATLQRIEAGGGTVLHEETEIPGVGWFAIAADPEGISFGIFKSK
jgi:predicted enzyme related to lactoylglutathione lyase